MKHPLFLLIVLSLLNFYTVSAQKSDGVDHILKATEEKFSFKDKTFFLAGKLPFKNIVVFDYRYDTSKVGYIQNGSAGYSKIQLKTSWPDILNNYFQSNLDQSSDKSLVVVIKSLWMQKGIIDELTTQKVIQRYYLQNGDYSGNCKAQLDVYLQSDSTFQALFKIEDTFLNFHKFKRNTLDEWLFLPFDSMAKKIIASDITALSAKKKKLNFEEINSFYTKRFELPFLKTELNKKGIFLTFEDFKNNKILEADIRIVTGKVTDELYLIQDGKEDLVTEFWGFNDGKNLFIKTGYNVFRAIRQQNSFEIYGGKHVTNYNNNPQPGQITISTMTVDKKILQLNMETGNFY